MKYRQIVIVALFPIILTACGSLGGAKQTGGTLLGAGLGGLAGSQIGGGKGRLAAVAVGTLLGAFVGNKVGQSLDRADRLFAKQTAQQSLEQTVGVGRTDGNSHGKTY